MFSDRTASGAGSDISGFDISVDLTILKAQFEGLQITSEEESMVDMDTRWIVCNLGVRAIARGWDKTSD